MFQPTREEVRRFFCDAWQKHRSAQASSALERIAIACVLEHPEYHALLEDREVALSRDFPVEDGRQNPFLHLSMHLTLAEQASIDQPIGVRALLLALQERCGSRHGAEHEAMECLGEIVWRAQRGTLPVDMASVNQTYLECLQRRLGSKI